MKRWLAALAVAVLLLVGSVVGSNALTQDEAVAYARQAGFEGEVHVAESAGPNGVYRTFECMGPWFCVPVEPYIVLFQPKGFPDDNMRLILLHEIAHDVQHNTEMPDGRTLWESMDSPQREWEADVWALRKAEELGMKDPLGKELSMWADILKKDGNRCGPYHGCIVDRMAYMTARVNPDLSGRQAP